MNEKLLESYLKTENKMAVAVSGGLDSVCLLSMCSIFAKKHHKTLFAFHINHGIRSESNQEEIFVENLCKQMNAVFVVKHLNVLQTKQQSKTTLEETARNLRYGAFEQMAQETGVNYVCLAHHAQDQAETFLLNVVRGSGLGGVCAMKEANGMYLRPLLNTSKEELQAYAKANNLSWVEDSSNNSTEYSRNFVRHNILPLLCQINPKAVQHIAQLSSKMQEVQVAIDQITPMPKMQSLNAVEIKNNSNAVVFANHVHKACNLLGVFKDIEQKHIGQIQKLFDAQNGKKINLTNGLVAQKENQTVVIFKQLPKKAQTSAKLALGKQKIGNTIVCLSQVKNAKFGNGNLYVDKNKIAKNSLIRTMQNGDIFQKLGSSGHKKLVDYFTDKKIPQRKRKSILLLAKQNEILAVLGYDISEKVKIDNNTTEILKIKISEE